jgi:hypothetical protein
VKLLGRNSKAGTVPYVEHKNRGGLGVLRGWLLFKKATDGREPRRHSEQPVE